MSGSLGKRVVLRNKKIAEKARSSVLVVFEG